MRVLFVNAVCGSGSTGRIVTDLCEILKQQGHQVHVVYGVGQASRIAPEDTTCISNKVDYYIHNATARITDRAGFYSHLATKKLIQAIKAFSPDVIHLHNLHGFYVNIKMLFEFLAEADIPVVWTLHDCWAMTGHCAHFSYVGCDKWKTGCEYCPQVSEYPKSYGVDQSRRNYADKKRLFTSVKNMTIVTPSEWLARIARQSFLNKYPVMSIPNGIDLNMFKPTPSDVREKYHIGNKKMVLAVSNVWNDKKGFPDMCELSKMLDPECYQVVMVGLTQEQIEQVPKTILPILRTSSVEELVHLYSAADVFMNFSYEETMGLVTAEALACGTPAVVYDKTAVPEVVDTESGVVVQAGDSARWLNAVERACQLDTKAAVARAKKFEKKEQYQKYLRVYQKMIS